MAGAGERAADRPEPGPQRPFETMDYAQFVATWARHCGAPPDVFEGQLRVTIAAELEAAGRDVIQAMDKTLLVNHKHWRALDRLLLDLQVHVETMSKSFDDDALKLSERVSKAREVLGLTTLLDRAQRGRE